MSPREVVVLSGMRTAIAKRGGALRGVSPAALASEVIRAALNRADVAPSEVGQVVFGNVFATEPLDLARRAVADAGCSSQTAAFTVNRLCGSGLQAVISVAQSIMLGDCNLAVAVGVESSSCVSSRNAPCLEDTASAEKLARACPPSLGAGYALALESRRRAAIANAAGRFNAQIVPMSVEGGEAATVFGCDELICGGRTAVRAAGSPAGFGDGAAALVLMEKRAAEIRRAKPIARLLSYAYAGPKSRSSSLGSVTATRAALREAGLTAADLDIIEADEAFAALTGSNDGPLRIDCAKVNPNGSAIALGSPLGATGAIMVVKAMHEVHRIGGRFALVALDSGGGQGMALILERLAHQ